MYLVLGALVLLGCAGAALFLFSRAPELPMPGTRAATTTALKADVFLTSTGAEETSVEQTVAILFGDTLRTSETGRALIDTDGGASVVLEYASTFMLTGDETHTTARLAAGQAWARVQKLFGQGEFFEIETDNAVAMVRGTSFGISYRESVSVVLVTEGTVAVMPRDAKTGVRDTERMILVREGQKATIDNGIVLLGPITDADRRERWYLENNPQTPDSTVEEPVRVRTPGESSAPIATSTPVVADQAAPAPKATSTPATANEATPTGATPNRDVQTAP